MKYLLIALSVMVILFAGEAIVYLYDNSPIKDFTMVVTSIDSNGNTVIETTTTTERIREVPAPSGTQIVSVHYLTHNDKNVTETIIFIRNLEDNTSKVVRMSGDAYHAITSDPSWLGERHFIFYSYCGTGCQGIVLLNTVTGQMKDGVISYLSKGFVDSDQTHLKDWNDQVFIMDGLMGAVSTKIDNDNKIYLIFSSSNSNENESSTTTYRYIFDEQTTLLTEIN